MSAREASTQWWVSGPIPFGQKGADDAKTGPLRVLVVDDNRDAADAVAVLLSLAGHEVDVAYDGPGALQHFLQQQPHVMLLDIGMPGMDGYEVCRSVRQQPGGDRVRIVALTGWGNEDDRNASREAGFDARVVKPVDDKTLKAIVAFSRSIGGHPSQ